MPGLGTELFRRERHLSAALEAADADILSPTVPALAAQARRARALVSAVLARRGLRGGTARALVARSPRHSDSSLPGGMITTVVAVSQDAVVTVTDGGSPGEPGPLGEAGIETDMYAPRGRGAGVAAEMPSGWGCYRSGSQLVTWFQVPVEKVYPR